MSRPAAAAPKGYLTAGHPDEVAPGLKGTPKRSVLATSGQAFVSDRFTTVPDRMA